MKPRYRRFQFWITEKIGNLLFRIHIPYRTTTSIAGSLEYGYGNLDGNGFWQFSVNPGLVYDRHKRNERKAGKK